MKNKFRAFTLAELLVSMIIAGIVVSMASYAFIIAYKRLDTYRQTGHQIREVLAAFSVIGNDVENAVKITGDERRMIFSSKVRDDIIYEFRGENIVRNDGLVNDTFFISNYNTHLRYIEPGEREERVIIEIFFESGEKIPFHYSKEYGSDILMRTENKN